MSDNVKEWELKRNEGKKFINQLIKNENLWNDKLKEDCKSGKVFLTFREKEITFYYKGCRLFGFDNKGFNTNVKYAAVINEKSGNIYEDKIITAKIIDNFHSDENYKRIIENCGNYAEKEGKEKYYLYKKNSYTLSEKKRYVVLDIEIAFKSKNIKGETGKYIPDILLYDNEIRKLRFIEAKCYNYSSSLFEENPPVIKQIQDYVKQIDKYEQDIKNVYSDYISGLNEIFIDLKLELKSPKSIDKNVPLLVFGDNEGQEQSEEFKKLACLLKKNNIPFYFSPDSEKIDAKILWGKTSTL